MLLRLVLLLLVAGALAIIGQELHGLERERKRARRREQPATCEAGGSHLAG